MPCKICFKAFKKQSHIITKELETIEKPNTFYTKSGTIKHLKTVAKLSKLKIIIQQPTKYNFIQIRKLLIVRYN